MRRIIAIAGPAQSGKSTVAAHLKTRGFVENSFAAPIRRCVADVLDITLDYLETIKDEVAPAFNCTPRKMMQTLGTEWGRQMIQDDLWIISLQERIRARSLDESIVIPDLRFENEATALRAMGAEIWHIKRPGTTIDSDHISEAGVNLHSNDPILINNGDLSDLLSDVDNLLGER